MWRNPSANCPPASVTRRLEYFLIVVNLKQWKFAQQQKNIRQSRFILLTVTKETLKKLSAMIKILVKVAKFGQIWSHWRPPTHAQEKWGWFRVSKGWTVSLKILARVRSVRLGKMMFIIEIVCSWMLWCISAAVVVISACICNPLNQRITKWLSKQARVLLAFSLFL